MKNYFFTVMIFTFMLSAGCYKEPYPKPDNCTSIMQVNKSHPMKDSLQAIINRYTAGGIPGIQVAVKNDDGFFITQSGYASLEKKNVMEPCNAGWLFSITKTYTAALIMLQKEKGLINLDEKIEKYLPRETALNIKGSDKITVRMLLNHSSGLVNFTDLPEYISRQFERPLDQPSVDDDVKMIYGKELISEPGRVFFYCNTNYLLLTAILEQLTGKSYGTLLKKAIIDPLHLDQTYYNPDNHQIKVNGLPDYYFDRNSNGQLENITSWNNAIGNASYGWGGIAATAQDVIKFYTALMNGQVVSNASLVQMKTWFKGEDSEAPEYGFGLEYYQFADNTPVQMGHEGDGLGNSTMILYVPGNKTYLYITCNAGRKLGGPFLFKITDCKNELGRYVAKWKS